MTHIFVPFSRLEELDRAFHQAVDDGGAIQYVRTEITYAKARGMIYGGLTVGDFTFWATFGPEERTTPSGIGVRLSAATDRDLTEIVEGWQSIGVMP